eukprot:SAG31_NODE_3343_length_4381_cov_12.838393_2_plen_86_part_00
MPPVLPRLLVGLLVLLHRPTLSTAAIELPGVVPPASDEQTCAVALECAGAGVPVAAARSLGAQLATMDLRSALDLRLLEPVCEPE